jgi:hypothetical protein
LERKGECEREGRINGRRRIEEKRREGKGKQRKIEELKKKKN